MFDEKELTAGGETGKSNEAALAASESAATAVPAGKEQLTQYRIANMCCPTEERLIRNRLEGMPGVASLDFNLMGRILGVHHSLYHQEPLLRALAGIGMEAEP
jgi:Cd2+/Zn2+-exporting ATPase